MFIKAKVQQDHYEGMLWWKKKITSKGDRAILIDESKLHYTASILPEERFVVVPKEVFLKDAALVQW